MKSKKTKNRLKVIYCRASQPTEDEFSSLVFDVEEAESENEEGAVYE